MIYFRSNRYVLFCNRVRLLISEEATWFSKYGIDWGIRKLELGLQLGKNLGVSVFYPPEGLMLLVILQEV